MFTNKYKSLIDTKNSLNDYSLNHCIYDNVIHINKALTDFRGSLPVLQPYMKSL